MNPNPSNSTESRDALESPNRAPIRLIFIGHGLATEIDNCDADLQAFKWGACTPHKRLTYAYGTHGAHRRKPLHRVIAERMGLEIKGKHVDHINGDTLDNRRSNLRAVSPSINTRNTDALSTQNTTGYRGVSKIKKTGRYRASIRTDYKHKHIGVYATAEEANVARLEAEAAEWGIEVRRMGAHQ